ncbi:MAG TPA: DMT family transporter [Alphaproteobacteria bacterium]|nr:DMT family transporter [Alphaproteobacteria bacterium]
MDEVRATAAPVSPWRGVAWMMAAVVSFSTMALCVRELSDTLSVYQILFMRSGVGLPLIVAAAALGGSGLRQLRTAQLKLQFIRNFVHLIGQWAWIYALTVLPLATVFAVEFTTPLWSVVMAAVLLGERTNSAQRLGLALGLVGTLVIVRPSPAGVSWDVLVMLVAALSYAAAHLSTRVLSRTDASVSVPFWMCLIQTPIGLVLALTDWRPIPLADVPLIVLLAACGLLAHHALTSAFRNAPVARVIPLDYLRLPLIATIGVLFYGEALDPFVFAGAAVVLAGVLITQTQRKPAD